jgi:glycosyltransferase involved in cell wall biosynthesis
MSAANQRVAFVASDYGGAGRIRSFWPAQALKDKGWNIVWADAAWPEPGSADVVIAHRPLGRDTVDQVQAHRTAGSIVLVDEDDDLTSIPKGFQFGAFNDTTYLNQLRKRHDTAIRLADGLIVSTPSLERIYGPLARQTWLVPNYLPRWISDQRFFRGPGEPVRVGWAGIVGTHQHDLQWLAPYTDQAINGAIFTSVGDMTVPRHLQISSIYVECSPFEWDIHAFYKLMARADIGMVPLDPKQKLNESKSWLKGLEYFLLGKPVVATATPEYRKLITHGSDGFLANNPKEFAQYVQRLIRDDYMRLSMSETARAKGLSMTLEKYLYVWEKPIRQSLDSLAMAR